MERIKQLTNDTYGSNNVGYRKTIELQSQRGSLQIAVEERPDHSKLDKFYTLFFLYIIYLFEVTNNIHFCMNSKSLRFVQQM